MSAIDKPLQETRARRQPAQARSQLRREQILQATASLLAEVGFNDLTTILIARRLSISVGALYHYYPNKVAILYAMAENWLNEIALALDEIAAQMPAIEGIIAFNDIAVDRLLEVYRQQKGMLPLVQAMWAVPELRAIDERHDELMITHLSRMFAELGLQAGSKERRRLARAYLELVHALALVVVEQTGKRAKRTSADLKAMADVLLQRDSPQDSE